MRRVTRSKQFLTLGREGQILEMSSFHGPNSVVVRKEHAINDLLGAVELLKVVGKLIDWLKKVDLSAERWCEPRPPGMDSDAKREGSLLCDGHTVPEHGCPGRCGQSSALHRKGLTGAGAALVAAAVADQRRLRPAFRVESLHFKALGTLFMCEMPLNPL